MKKFPAPKLNTDCYINAVQMRSSATLCSNDNEGVRFSDKKRGPPQFLCVVSMNATSS
ncbi:hypothetical protein KIN20_016413 [Parelaphostrongylus tenuis]|uniref:Uncharacterized protein n=1 Tax=Parelaphostrongylus tenuis TaxID=148309 RepID=A0AAD5MK01_PARTN|nr:hypothetical protein KIN20_016413 [Parelaphostrongylus tenuis]